MLFFGQTGRIQGWSSNSYPSATANYAVHSLKWGGGGGTTRTGTSYDFDSMKRCTRLPLKLFLIRDILNNFDESPNHGPNSIYHKRFQRERNIGVQLMHGVFHGTFEHQLVNTTAYRFATHFFVLGSEYLAVLYFHFALQTNNMNMFYWFKLVLQHDYICL